MNKITFFILAILSSSNAFSSWNLLIKIKSDTYYYDPDSIKKNGNLVSLNFLVNYTKPEPSESGIPVYSNISRAEFDCSKNKYRTLKSDHYKKIWELGILFLDSLRRTRLGLIFGFQSLS